MNNNLYNQTVPTNQLWYVTTNNKPLETSNDSFDVNIVSNVYENGLGVITFDAPLVEIRGNVGRWSSHLRAVYLPDSIEVVGDGAFSCNDGLREIKLGKGVKRIECCAFRECKRLMSITIPDSVVSIGISAFSGCTALREVNFGPNSSLREIEGCAFLHCANLTVVELPENVVSVGPSCFLGCGSIVEFRGRMATDDGLALIDDNGAMVGFANGCGLEEYAIPEGVKEVISGVFSNNYALRSLTFPKSLRNVSGSSNFLDCEHLKEFKGKFASKDGRCLIRRKRLLAVLLNGLTDYSIPQGVKYIDAESSFVGADNLKSIAFPEGLREIVLPSWYEHKPLSCVVYPSTLTKFDIFDIYMIAPYVFSKLHIFKGVEAPKTCRYCYLGLKGSTILVPKASFKAYEESLLSGLQYVDATLFKEPGYYPVDRYDGDWGVDNDASKLNTRVEVELIGVEL